MPSNLFLAVGSIIALAAWLFASTVTFPEAVAQKQLFVFLIVVEMLAGPGLAFGSPYLLFVLRSNVIGVFARWWGARFRRCVPDEELGEWCPSLAMCGWDKVRNVVQLDVDGFTVTAFDQFRFEEWSGIHSGTKGKWPFWQTRVVVAGCEIPDDLVRQHIGKLAVTSTAAEKYVCFERTEWLCFPWNIRRFMLKSVGLVKKMQEELAQLKSGAASANDP